jgi:hypothetical protein
MHTPRALRLVLTALASTTLATGLVVADTSPAHAAGPKSATITMRLGIDGKGAQQPNGGGDSIVSANGRYVAFFDLGTGSTYLEDLATTAVTKVSVTPGGIAANENAIPLGVSNDGKRVTFGTKATNLAPAPHTAADVYLRDLEANTTTRMNIGTNGKPLEVYDSEASMSDDGTAIAWTGVDGHVWVRRTTSPTTVQADVSSAEVSANDTTLGSRITGDGKHVVFDSFATNLAADNSSYLDVFERDLVAGTTAKVSFGFNGVEATASVSNGSGSYDGRYVAFVTAANNLSPADKNPGYDVFVRDTLAQTTTIASVAGLASSIGAHAEWPLISGDGRHVLFETTSNSIAIGDTAGTKNLFLRDLAAQTTVAVDRSTGMNLGKGSQLSYSTSISSDGSVVGFRTNSDNLVAGDTNGRDDAFVRMPVSMGPHPSLSELSTTVHQRFVGSTSAASAATADLVNGRNVPGHLIAQLAHDPAFAQHREPITRLYFAFFERQPDLNGLDYWVAKRKAGTNLNTIATKFAQSSEFKTKYGSVGNSTFVTLVYQNVLDRNPDAAGLAHWVAKMSAGMTRGQVMVQFSESSEGKRHLAPSVDASIIGLGMLGKMPAPADFTAARAAWLSTGASEGAARWFLDSPAYAASVS